MVEPGFTVVADPSRNLLRTTVWGYWNIALVERIAGEIDRAQRSLITAGCPDHERVVLVDARNHGIQSQEVVARLTEVATTIGKATRRQATLVAGALQRMQTQRIAVDLRKRMFVDEDEALAWLLEPVGV